MPCAHVRVCVSACGRVCVRKRLCPTVCMPVHFVERALGWWRHRACALCVAPLLPLLLLWLRLPCRTKR